MRSNATSNQINKSLSQLFLQTVQEIAVDDGPYSILDFPDHSNVGDSAIYLGELHTLRQIFGRDPAFVASLRAHPRSITRCVPDGTIFLHGGGNLGDIWPKCQTFRASILKTFRSHRIVQLPQTIHFNAVRALDDFARIIDEHPDFTLLVRDQRSFELAKKKFNCAVVKCPDAAHTLGPLKRSKPPLQKLLLLLRCDKESAHEQGAGLRHLSGISLEDWVGEPKFKSFWDTASVKSASKIPTLTPVLAKRQVSIFEKWARWRVERGINQLSEAQRIVTDRLHVHILSSLLGIEHVVIDNNYGKVFSYLESWPLDPLTRTAETPISALRTLRKKI